MEKGPEKVKIVKALEITKEVGQFQVFPTF